MELVDKYNINKYINYLLIGYALSVPLSKAGTNFFSIIILVLWLVQGEWKYKFEQFKSNPLILGVISLILFSLISVIWARDIQYGLEYVGKYRHFLMILIIYTALEYKYIEYMFTAFLTAMFASELVSYAMFFGYFTYHHGSVSDPTPFMSHTNYSVFLSFTSIILLLRYFNENVFKYKVLYMLFFISATSNLFINGGRTGQIIFVVSILIMTVMHFKNKLKASFIAIVLLVSLFGTAYQISPNFHNRSNQAIADFTNILHHDSYVGSFGQRVSLWVIGIEQFKHHPLLGAGIGNEMNELVSTADALGFDSQILDGFSDYHNVFITYAIQLGILGFIIPILIFYSLLTLNIKNPVYKNLSIVFAVSFFLFSFTGMTFHIMFGMLYFSLFAGLFNKIMYFENIKLTKY